jgi:hypothetical protein
LVLACCSLVLAGSAEADSTVLVSAQCSLSDAVAYADGTSEPGCASGTASGTTTIMLPSSASEYEVTSTLTITAGTVIQGAGAAHTVIGGGGSVRVLDNQATLVVSGVTITDGLSPVSAGTCGGSSCGVGTPGGAIYNTGTLTLDDAVVSDSHTAGGTAPTVSCDPTTGCPGSNAGAGGGGGGIYNDGSLTVTGSTITGNGAGAGGDGTEGIEGTDGASEGGGDAGNGGNGGGIYNDASGSLQISDSTISDNRAGLGGTGGEGLPVGMPSTMNGGSSGNGGAGGGIYSANGLAITDSTISANHAGGAGSAALRGGAPGTGGAGGGIDNSGGTGASTITNVTITGNASGAAGHEAFLSDLGPAGAGGGIEQVVGALELEFVTLAADQAPASSFPGPSGVYGEIGVSSSASVDLENSIIDDEQVGNGGPYEECTSGVQDGGGNVQFGAQQATCPGTVADPKLATLANNGGPTETMALEAGSAAIDRVPARSCSQPTDQRGVARPPGGCDAGAYQLAPPSISAFRVKATSPTTITVSGEINPNLSAHTTTVTVRYGTTSAFGSSTTAKDIGAGETPVPFTATPTRLTAGTTYHVELVATNGDGTSIDPLGTVTTPGYPRIKAQIMAAWAFARRSTKLLELRLSHIPSGGAVHVICHGGGCPFAHRTFKVKHGAASATSAFKDHRLKPKATVEIEITAQDSVGEAMVFTIRTRRPPSATRRCMPPGTRSPTACAERQRDAARLT